MQHSKTCCDCGEQFKPPRKFPEATRCRECYETAKPRLESERAERKRRLELVKSVALHKWPETLAAFGINRDLLTPKHGPCPGCGGTDRFRFDDKDGRGTWICSQGGGEPAAGDGFALLAHVKRIDNREAFMLVADHFGLLDQNSDPPPPAPEPPPPAATVSATQVYAIDVWARVNRDDDIVGAHPYAIAKGITWAAGAGRARVSGRLIGRDADCIVVPVRNLATGAVQSVECINAQGVKQTFGSKEGAALALGNTINPRLERYVVEGWATAAKHWQRMGDVCVYVAFGAGRMKTVGEWIEQHRPGGPVYVAMEAPRA